MRKHIIFILIAFIFIYSNIANAAGPLVVNKDGNPVLWDASKPVPFTLDQGDLGLLSNAEAVQITKELFQIWENVATASITFQQDGQLVEDITGDNILSFNNDLSSDTNPIIFDDDGSITDALKGVGANEVTIGFAGPKFTSLTATGARKNIISSLAVMNGRFFDGLPEPDDITLADYRGTFAHEFGHYIGLAHTQVNLEQFYLSGVSKNVPLMFPIALEGIGETLQKDDISSVSNSYPVSSFSSSTGTIKGSVFMSDGITQFQGANVIAREVSNPEVNAVSSVSGIFHLDPANPDFGGSSDAQLVGFYEISGLDSGDYIVSIEQIDPLFVGGSGVGSLQEPVPLPGLPEFFNTIESNNDSTECASTVSVSGGEIVDNIDFIMNNFGSTGTDISEIEPNDSFSGAQSVPTLASISGNVAPGDEGEVFLTSGDGLKDFYEDVYSIQVSAEQWTSFTLSNNNSSSDLDLFILSEDESFFIKPFTSNPGMTEVIAPLLLAPGKYFVAISIVDGVVNPSTSYTLDIISTCVGDSGSIPSPTPDVNSTPTSTPIPSPTITQTGPSKEAELEVSFNPNPVIQSSNGAWNFRVFVEERNGTGVTINNFNITGDDGQLLLDGNSADFVQLFTSCGDQADGFIAALDTACADFTRTGSSGVDTYTFNGVDELGNSIQAKGSVTLQSESSDKSFTFKCDRNPIEGRTGLERFVLEIGDNESCVLKLTQLEPNSSIEISTNLKSELRSCATVEPERAFTNVNGEVEFTITAINKGIDWFAWAVANEDGKFEFNKKAYNLGEAWGMFVEVK